MESEVRQSAAGTVSRLQAVEAANRSPLIPDFPNSAQQALSQVGKVVGAATTEVRSAFLHREGGQSRHAVHHRPKLATVEVQVVWEYAGVRQLG